MYGKLYTSYITYEKIIFYTTKFLHITMTTLF